MDGEKGDNGEACASLLFLHKTINVSILLFFLFSLNSSFLSVWYVFQVHSLILLNNAKRIEKTKKMKMYKLMIFFLNKNPRIAHLFDFSWLLSVLQFTCCAILFNFVSGHDCIVFLLYCIVFQYNSTLT